MSLLFFLSHYRDFVFIYCLLKNYADVQDLSWRRCWKISQLQYYPFCSCALLLQTPSYTHGLVMLKMCSAFENELIQISSSSSLLWCFWLLCGSSYFSELETNRKDEKSHTAYIKRCINACCSIIISCNTYSSFWISDFELTGRVPSILKSQMIWSRLGFLQLSLILMSF